MGCPLPTISPDDFAAALAGCSPERLAAEAVESLYSHYLELARWNRTLSLVGPGTADEIVTRHYGEALAALPLIPAGDRVGLDVGSGAGFPGLVLAAARPRLAMTLVEARERKWAFLAAAARRGALPCHCLNARVDLPLPAGLPEGVEVITVRALKLEPGVLAALAERLAADGQFLLWIGRDDPDLPPGLTPAGSLELPGSRVRRILRLRRTAG
jgi:16S rRNA (guanine(527)-N(7))-methyltransferase RsmG